MLRNGRDREWGEIEEQFKLGHLSYSAKHCFPDAYGFLMEACGSPLGVLLSDTTWRGGMRAGLTATKIWMLVSLCLVGSWRGFKTVTYII